MERGLVGKRHQHELVAIPDAFQHGRRFIRRQQPSAEFPEHVEEPRLVAVIGGAVGHLQLHDHIDGQIQFLPARARCSLQFAHSWRVHFAISNVMSGATANLCNDSQPQRGARRRCLLQGGSSMNMTNAGRGLVRRLGLAAGALLVLSAASLERAEALSLASPGMVPVAKSAADGLKAEVRGGHGGGWGGGHGGGGGFHGGGAAFHGGGFRSGGVAFHGGGYRFHGGGYRYGGFRGYHVGGYRYAFHRHHFHRRFYYAPSYYYYPHRYCRVVWTYYGPRRVCPWRHHHWHHRWHHYRYW